MCGDTGGHVTIWDISRYCQQLSQCVGLSLIDFVINSSIIQMRLFSDNLSTISLSSDQGHIMAVLLFFISDLNILYLFMFICFHV